MKLKLVKKTGKPSIGKVKVKKKANRKIYPKGIKKTMYA
jgi:hypothetical protein